jgi:hypothetical protein
MASRRTVYQGKANTWAAHHRRKHGTVSRLLQQGRPNICTKYAGACKGRVTHAVTAACTAQGTGDMHACMHLHMPSGVPTCTCMLGLQLLGL